MADAAKLKLAINQAGVGSVSLNDIDIGAFTTCIEFKAKVGGLTEIRLTIWAEVDAEITARLDQIALCKIDEPQKEPDGLRLMDGRVLRPRART